jgi:hypothetical protein
LFHAVFGNTSDVTGSNLRFGALMLLYPQRFDFLVLFPALVVLIALMLADVLKRAGLPRGALVAVPCFAFQSFQDTYWFAGHVAPIVLLFAFFQVGKVVNRGCVRRTPNPA